MGDGKSHTASCPSLRSSHRATSTGRDPGWEDVDRCWAKGLPPAPLVAGRGHF